MAKLNDDTQVLLDGAVKVYKRNNTKRWQATFQIDGHWVRISTGKRDVNGGIKSCHWGGVKVGHFGVRALERAALI